MANNGELQSREEQPMLQSGAFVKETGLATVHERDYMMPPPGAKAANRADAKPGQPL